MVCPPSSPRWKPEDVEALLERYEEQLSAIEAQDTVLPMDTVAGSGLRVTPPSLPDSSASTVAEPLPGCGRTAPLCAPRRSLPLRLHDRRPWPSLTVATAPR